MGSYNTWVEYKKNLILRWGPRAVMMVSRTPQIWRHVRGQLATSWIGNLTRLIHTLLYVMTIHTYMSIMSVFAFSCIVLEYSSIANSYFQAEYNLKAGY